MVLFTALLAGRGGGASAAGPVGANGESITVTPSTELPSISTATVHGDGFLPDTSVPDYTVRVAECVPSIGACGPETVFNIMEGATFDGTITVVRMLSLSDTTVDCVQVTCEVWATSGGSFASHPLSFAVTTTTAPTSTTGRKFPPVVDTAVTTVTTVALTTTPPTTVRKSTTTTPAPSTTVVPPTTTQLKSVPRGTAVATPTTEAKPPATSTTVAPTTSTSAPTTTTTVPPPPTDNRPPLVAVTPKNESAGPPGGGLQVEGTGYTCDTVYFFFDGTRVGSGSPDAAGLVHKGGLSVPGDAGSGRHEVTSSCQASGDVVEQSSIFQVLPTSVHRPAFVTSLPLPDQISLSPHVLLTSAAVALGGLLLIAFPFELFNSTMEENYDEIRAWFRLPARGVDIGGSRRRAVSFFVLTAVSAVACGFLSPDFGLNMTSLVMAVGMFVALLVMAVVFSVPADLGIHREYGEWGKLNFLPGSVVVSILMVVASRVFHFQPGYFYGALAGLAFRSALTERVQGRMTAANWVFSLVVSVVAWFARIPVSTAAARPGASVWWIGLEVCLALIFLWGVEGLAVAMLPLHFLDGRKVFRWNRAAWAVLFFLGLFATFEILMAPGSGYVGHTTGGVAIGVMVLYAGFGIGSVALWAYFRFRPQHWAPATS